MFGVGDTDFASHDVASTSRSKAASISSSSHNSSPSVEHVSVRWLSAVWPLHKWLSMSCHKIRIGSTFPANLTRGRIFSHAGNELGASSFPARTELSMLFPYTLLPAGNELVFKLTKNTASGKTKYCTGKDLYHWSRGKSRLFLLTLKKISVLINKLDFHGTNGCPILPICLQYSLI